jgi:hypothetical protein
MAALGTPREPARVARNVLGDRRAVEGDIAQARGAHETGASGMRRVASLKSTMSDMMDSLSNIFSSRVSVADDLGHVDELAGLSDSNTPSMRLDAELADDAAGGGLTQPPGMPKFTDLRSVSEESLTHPASSTASFEPASSGDLTSGGLPGADDHLTLPLDTLAREVGLAVGDDDEGSLAVTHSPRAAPAIFARRRGSAALGAGALPTGAGINMTVCSLSELTVAAELSSCGHPSPNGVIPSPSEESGMAWAHGPKLHACKACVAAKTGCSDVRPCLRCAKMGLDCDDHAKTVKRSCTACKKAKAKCNLDTESGQPCSRCAKSGGQCVPYIAPPSHKPRKKSRSDGELVELPLPSPAFGPPSPSFAPAGAAAVWRASADAIARWEAAAHAIPVQPAWVVGQRVGTDAPPPAAVDEATPSSPSMGPHLTLHGTPPQTTPSSRLSEEEVDAFRSLLYPGAPADAARAADAQNVSAPAKAVLAQNVSAPAKAVLAQNVSAPAKAVLATPLAKPFERAVSEPLPKLAVAVPLVRASTDLGSLDDVLGTMLEVMHEPTEPDTLATFTRTSDVLRKRSSSCVSDVSAVSSIGLETLSGRQEFDDELFACRTERLVVSAVSAVAVA